MKKLLSRIVGSSWKTSAIGYIQFLIAAAFEAFGTGETDWTVIAQSAIITVIARKSADSSLVKKLQEALAKVKAAEQN